jgi:two-component system, OmpR family, sensor histidine kinase CiaH
VSVVRTTTHVPGVRAASIRVVLMATAMVGAAYLLVAVAVVLIVTRNLTSQLDADLADALRHIGTQPEHPSGPDGYETPGPRTPFGRQVFTWTIHTDGTVNSIDASTVLPAEYRQASDPQTVTIASEPVRIAGAAVRDEYVVVGERAGSVSETQSNLVLAELLIGPILLAAVFFGAVAIGRRVAAPIEHARQRQLEFTADASHELRTPLSVIEAQTSLALSQDRPLEWYRRAFTQVDAESKRIRRLVEDLLWLARFDSMSGRPDAEPVDVGVLAAQTVDRFAIVAEAHHLHLDVHAGAGTNIVTVPPEWLDRLLGVLLDNACKYSPEGGSVSVAVVSESGRTRLTVDDSGPGIPVDERGRIFDRFHRATDKQGGSGLGLAIADAIVRATNGRWRIGVSPAGGASMSVTWPRSFGGSSEAATAASTRKAVAD